MTGLLPGLAPPPEGARPLFARRGQYSDEDIWERIGRERDALSAAATSAGVSLPRGFATLSAAEALRALAVALPGGRHRTLIREIFEATGPFGDEGTVRAFRLTSAVSVPRVAPMSDLVDTELNAEGPYALTAEGAPLRGECLLVDAAMDGRQAVYRFTFVDIVQRKEIDPQTREIVLRERREPTDIDAVIDFDRGVVAIHSGASEHVHRLRTLLGQALSTGQSIVTCDEFDPLTDPIMHALIDGFDGWVPGGRVEPLNAQAAVLSYGTRDQSESRRNASNLRTRREGKHVALRGVVMLSRLNGRGLDREVPFSVATDWTLVFKRPIEPLVYFRVLDELIALMEWVVWARSLADLAEEGLKPTVGAAMTDMEIQNRAEEYAKGVEDTFGTSLGTGNEFRRRVVIVDVVNALWRVGPNGPRLPVAARLQLSPGLKALFDDLSVLHTSVYTRDQRTAAVRAVLQALEAARGDRPRFFTACAHLARQ